MMTALIFIIVLGVLVFVHEMGHFLVARRNGIKADEFGFGFPPRLAGIVWDDTTKKYRFVKGNEEVVSPHTVYSLNWIPLGGFVKIKGEDGVEKDPDSFAVKSPWIRIKVLAAGVVMNFLFAWILLAFVFALGFPQAVDSNAPVTGNQRDVRISKVLPGTPAESMGLRAGDTIRSFGDAEVAHVAEVQQYILEHKGKEIVLSVERGSESLTLRGTPRAEYPENEGSLGIGLGETELVLYTWYEAIWQGALATYHITLQMFFGILDLLSGLITGSDANIADVSGPVGIAKLTGEMNKLGFSYLLYFAAILSINLGVINILPIPALDGGRILFILIEIIKGSPVSRKVEGTFHQISFLLLLLLMLLITIHDVINLNIFGA